MDSLKEFFDANDVRVGDGKDFTVNPPIYYSSLHDGFYHFFRTYRERRNFYNMISLELKRESLAFSMAGVDDKIIFSILSFHRFFELLLKDLLRRINPFLAVKFLERDEEIFLFFDNKVTADEVKTIEYSETIKRVKRAFKYYDKTSDIYIKLLSKYEFIIDADNLETLNILTEWRNRIMHNGNTFPNLLAFDYLISQRLTPLIIKIVEADKDILGNYLPHYFETNTGINLLGEISKIQYNFQDITTPVFEEVMNKLRKLEHLKELGRAAYGHDLFMRKNIHYYESSYDNPIGRAVRFAESERKNNDNSYDLKSCVCCGEKALVVYRKEVDDIFSNTSAFISWLKCYNCEYSIKEDIGDPFDFGLSKERLFPTINIDSE